MGKRWSVVARYDNSVFGIKKGQHYLAVNEFINDDTDEPMLQVVNEKGEMMSVPSIMLEPLTVRTSEEEGEALSDKAEGICSEHSKKMECRKECPLSKACVTEAHDTREIFNRRMNAAAAALPEKPMLRVELGYAPNPDIQGDGYWGPLVDPATPVMIDVKDFAEASAVCRAYIERNGLGGGNWTGGEVVDMVTAERVAHVSYNGRVWGLDGKEIK